MPTKKAEVRTVRHSYVCDECAEGEMEVDEQMWLMTGADGDIYPHKCNRCGHVAYLSKYFPYNEYVECATEVEPGIYS